MSILNRPDDLRDLFVSFFFLTPDRRMWAVVRRTLRNDIVLLGLIGIALAIGGIFQRPTGIPIFVGLGILCGCLIVGVRRRRLHSLPTLTIACFVLSITIFESLVFIQMTSNPSEEPLFVNYQTLMIILVGILIPLTPRACLGWVSIAGISMIGMICLGSLPMAYLRPCVRIIVLDLPIPIHFRHR